MRWLVPLLFLVFAAMATAVHAEPPSQHVYFPGPITQGSGVTGIFGSLQVGPGSVSINGTPGSSITGIGNINGWAYANGFAGADIGVQVNQAIAALGAQGGTVMIGPGSYTFNTTIQCPQNADIPIIIQGAGASDDYNAAGTTLIYSGSGDAINDMSNLQNARGCELRDFTLDGGTAGPTSIGLHFGATIYSRTQMMMFRGFGTACIKVENTPSGPGNNFPAPGSWTERYDFHQTSFTECGNSAASTAPTIWFHDAGGNQSFMHGKMDIHVGMFGSQNGIVVDGTATPVSVDFNINGNLDPTSTGSLIKLTQNSWLAGKLTLNPECMNTASCTRFDLDASSHLFAQVSGYLFGAAPAGVVPWVDKLPAGADLQVAQSDTRFVGTALGTCFGNHGLNPGQTVEMFTVKHFDTFAAGPLTVASRYTGNATTTLYNLATTSCGSTPSFSVAHSTFFAGGAPFTVTETCHPADVVGGGTPTNPQYPAGSTTYSVTNTAAQPVNLTWTFLNTIRDPLGYMVAAPLGDPFTFCASSSS